MGWLGPGLTQTFETPELLAAAGVKYIGDWVYDDEPFRIKYLEQVYAHINRQPGVLHWNGEQILDWYLQARGKR